MWPVSCASTRPKAFAYSLARMCVYVIIAPRVGAIAFAPCVVPPWSRRKECTSLEEPPMKLFLFKELFIDIKCCATRMHRVGIA
jgi:hypothetical protein